MVAIYNLLTPYSSFLSVMSSVRGITVITGAAQGIGRGVTVQLKNNGLDISINNLPLSEKIAKSRKRLSENVTNQ